MDSPLSSETTSPSLFGPSLTQKLVNVTNEALVTH